MALERKDRVKDQTATTGTGTITVDGVAPTGYRTITSAHSTGATLRYVITNTSGSEWEVGEGVWTSATNTLTRVTVYASSNSGSLVSFSSGTKTVFTGPVSQDFADYAPLASPALTGTPTAPTAAAATNTTQVATTAHVFAERTNTATITNKTLTSPTLTTPVATGLRETKVAVAAADIDLSLGNWFTKTITAATTFTASNVPATGTVASFILELTNGGAFTISWSASFGTNVIDWAGGTQPTLTAAGKDVLGFYTYDGGATWIGLVLGKDVK